MEDIPLIPGYSFRDCVVSKISIEYNGTCENL